MKYLHPNRSLRVTSSFDEMRPLVGKKTHKHGATDFAGPVGTDIYAAEDGHLQYYAAFREGSVLWPPDEIPGFPFKNYFYDTYGGIAVLVGDSGNVYLYCHLYMNQIFNFHGLMNKWVYLEERKHTRKPIHCFMSSARNVSAGEIIARVGNAGFSTGPHLHLEVHRSFKWDRYEDRVDPEELFKGE